MPAIAYSFDQASGEFNGQVVAYDDPLAQVPDSHLLPANATYDAPPAPAVNQAAVFHAGAWSLVADYRRQVFYLPDGSMPPGLDLGQSPDPTWSTTKPPPSLAALQATQIAVLTAACDAEIAAGYISTALGAAYTYPTKTTDQLNMSASVVASLLPGIAGGWTTPFWCADAAGVWAMREHTAAQIQQAGSDGKALIQAAQVKLAVLSAQVMAAADAAAVQAVAW